MTSISMPIRNLLILPLFLLCIVGAAQTHASNGSGLAGKIVVGYQGWFGCPNDFEGNTEWQHWFHPGGQPKAFQVDLLPHVDAFKISDLCDTGLPRVDGQGTIKVFSSQNPNIVDTHFRWMRSHQIDGVAVQRFVTILEKPGKKRRGDHVLQNIQSAAQANERFFFIVYDVSGANSSTVIREITQDWRHLVDDLKLTDHPFYLRHKGKPVLELWGFGFKTRPGDPSEVATLQEDLKKGRNGLTPVTLIGGVPTQWRTLAGDSKPETQWAAVYRNFDVISPWAVGRFSDQNGADAFIRNNVTPDFIETKRLNIDYMPVVFPGFSWYNLQANRSQPKQVIVNQTPRECGAFYWRQISSLLNLRVNMLYAAMFDEVNEGTALFPTEAQQHKMPAGVSMVYLNQDGCSLPEDWYLKITGEAAKFLRHNTLPPKKLEDVIRP